MRLAHLFVVLAATFLVSSGALAATNTDSVIKTDSYVKGSKPATHRALRTYKADFEDDDDDDDDDEEERGIKDIPLERLQSLGRKVGVSADDVLSDAAGVMRTMSESQIKQWTKGLNKLKQLYKKAKSPRISDY
ncbi:hypothetical protein DVH05_018541 [Phytophthora capsici]|nr:hypothetical protein DVH05_018541 [Phytophthora capsici]